MQIDEKRVMVVDDDEHACKLVQRILEKQGYKVAVAHDGKECIEKVQAYGPHVIIMDYMMPVMDGLEALAALKAKPETKQIPVLFLTGRGEREVVLRAVKLGAADFILKPIPIAELPHRLMPYTLDIDEDLIRDVFSRINMPDRSYLKIPVIKTLAGNSMESYPCKVFDIDGCVLAPTNKPPFKCKDFSRQNLESNYYILLKGQVNWFQAWPAGGRPLGSPELSVGSELDELLKKIS